MFSNILIPTDLGDRTTRALDAARELAPRGSVRLLHVIQTIEGAAFKELEGFYGELETRARHRLAEIAAARTEPGEIHTEVAYGAPVTEVLRVCREREIDLVVLASHPVQPQNPGIGWGTVSYKVGLLAPCPVLLVK